MPTPFNAGSVIDTGLTRTRTATDPTTGLPLPPAEQPAVRTRLPEGYTTTPPVAATPVQVGSPLNTLYGIDSESYLTPDQQKLARMIQGKFDASANRRDRELARYGAPRLSSFVEDESLARAMAQAQGLNYRPPPDPFTGAPRQQTRLTQPFGNNSPRVAPPTTRPTPDTHNPAQWQRILSGLASVAPLLFGRDAFGQFVNRGLFGTIKDALFGKGASAAISDAQLEQIVQNGGMVDPGTGLSINPLTGLPTGLYTSPDFVGPPSDLANDLTIPTFDPGSWADWSWGNGGLSDWWSGWTPASGGDILDAFGGV